MDAFAEYSSSLETLVSLPTVLDQRIRSIEEAASADSAELERTREKADQRVAESRRLVAGVLKDSRDVLTRST